MMIMILVMLVMMMMESSEAINIKVAFILFYFFQVILKITIHCNEFKLINNIATLPSMLCNVVRRGVWSPWLCSKLYNFLKYHFTYGPMERPVGLARERNFGIGLLFARSLRDDKNFSYKNNKKHKKTLLFYTNKYYIVIIK